MILVRPSFTIENISCYPAIDKKASLRFLERIGRVCYKSEEKQTDNSCEQFVKSLIDRHHESVVEHGNITVKFIIDRGVSHELVRHRLCSFSQESTRYCNYKGGVSFVIPPWCPYLEPMDTSIDGIGDLSPKLSLCDIKWLNSMQEAESAYISLLANGWTPQQARSVLPNSLKTEIVTTANFREWRHIFQVRTSKAAHPQMREIMTPLLNELKKRIPVLFEDIGNDT